MNSSGDDSSQQQAWLSAIIPPLASVSLFLCVFAEIIHYIHSTTKIEKGGKRDHKEPFTFGKYIS